MSQQTACLVIAFLPNTSTRRYSHHAAQHISRSLRIDGQVCKVHVVITRGLATSRKLALGASVWLHKRATLRTSMASLLDQLATIGTSMDRSLTRVDFPIGHSVIRATMLRWSTISRCRHCHTVWDNTLSTYEGYTPIYQAALRLKHGRKITQIDVA